MALPPSIALLVVTLCLAQGQRPPYAGSRPIGYPELADRFQSEGENRPAYENNFDAATQASIDNRFGETTTRRIPIDALGDRYLVEMISRWPVDKQPFWFVNAMHIERQRNRTTAEIQAANAQNAVVNPQNQPINLNNGPTNQQNTGRPNQQNLPTDQQNSFQNQPLNTNHLPSNTQQNSVTQSSNLNPDNQPSNTQNSLNNP